MLFNTIVLLRHGESLWNHENRFTGWTDVNLSQNGKDEAKRAGLLLKNNDYSFDSVYTSCLKRANLTMDICLKEMLSSDIEVVYDWRLNERHYGALQGLNKSETAKKFGEEQVFIWRRSYDIPPPPLELGDKRHPCARFSCLWSPHESHRPPPTSHCERSRSGRRFQTNSEVRQTISSQLGASPSTVRVLYKLVAIDERKTRAQ